MQPVMVRRLSWEARWSGRAARAPAARPLQGRAGLSPLAIYFNHDRQGILYFQDLDRSGARGREYAWGKDELRPLWQRTLP